MMKQRWISHAFLTISCLSLFFSKARAAPKSSVTNDLYVRDGTNLPYALKELQASCSEEERKARADYLKTKQHFSRSLSSLDFEHDDVIDKLKSAQKKLNRELRRISNECREEKEKLLREAKPRSAWVPLPATKQKEKKPLLTRVPKPEEPKTEPFALIKNFRLHGRLIQETAYRISQPHEFTKNRSVLILEQSTRVNEDLRFKFSERGFYDAAVVHINNENIRSYEKNDLASEVELRDAYMDYSSGNIDLRLGKQQIVWGEAVSAFVADVVNGKDLREFILPDFEQMRLPQWSALLSRQEGDMHLEGVVSIPRFNKLPTANSEFAYSSAISSGVTVISSEVVKPETSLSNADIGFRISYLFGGLDTGFFFLHTWDKTPVPFRTIKISTFQFHPEYEQEDVFGLTFSKDVFDAIVKGELAVRPQTYFPTSDLRNQDGVVKLTSYEYILGLDQTWFKKWDMNVQIDQRFLSGNATGIINEDKTRTLLSAWLKGRFWNDKVQPEYLIVGDATKRDRMHRPKITFKLADWVLLKVGADIFEGRHKQGVFGVFDDKDRGYAQVEFHF